MFKKVLSIVLFATMLLSLGAFANATEDADLVQDAQELIDELDLDALDAAADEPLPATEVAFVAVYNAINDYEMTASVAPGDSAVGILVPGTLDAKGNVIPNELTVTGAFESITSKEYNVYVVFDGLLDADIGDYLSLNSSYLKLSDEELFTVTEDGNYSVLKLSFTLIKSGDNSSAKDYQLHFVKDGGITYDFDFTVRFVDKAVDADALEGEVDYEYLALLPASFFESEVIEAEEEVDEEAEEVAEEDEFDPTIANAVVNASRLNIRASASVNSDIVGKLDNGDGITIVETEGNWYLIVDTEGEPVGYVFNKYVDLL